MNQKRKIFLFFQCIQNSSGALCYYFFAKESFLYILHRSALFYCVIYVCQVLASCGQGCTETKSDSIGNGSDSTFTSTQSPEVLSSALRTIIKDNKINYLFLLMVLFILINCPCINHMTLLAETRCYGLASRHRHIFEYLPRLTTLFFKFSRT